MSAIINKATGLINTTVAKSAQLANSAVYWGKVGAEVGKAVYKAEGLAPPSLAQFKQAYEASVKFLQTPAQQKALQEKITSLPLNKDTFTKAAVYGIHGLAFFSIGEIIGRRSFFGYPALGHAEHH